MELYTMLVMFVALIVVVLCLIGIAHLLIGPINRARTHLQAPSRFVLTDLFWLMILLQISLAFATQFVYQDQNGSLWLILGFLVFATISIWIGGVNFMSQAGIRKIGQRALFQLVLLPGTLLTMIGLPAVFIITLQEFFSLSEQNWRDPFHPLYLSWAALIVGSLLLRLLSSWLARTAISNWHADPSKATEFTPLGEKKPNRHAQ